MNTSPLHLNKNVTPWTTLTTVKNATVRKNLPPWQLQNYLEKKNDADTTVNNDLYNYNVN